MKNPYAVVIKPVITEKTTDIKEKVGTLCFEVDASANKVDIKRAVERIYGVKVKSVRTASVEGKLRRLGRFEGKRSSWRKAFITLREGEKTVDYFA